MNSSGFIAVLLPFLRENILIVILACIGLIFLGNGVMEFLGQKPPEEEIVIEEANEPQEITAFVTVDVSGAVGKPGVYSLPSTSRVHDALEMAGGLSDQANHEIVAQTINLAKPLTDGEKVYVPFMTEESGNEVLAATTGKTSINTATSTDLEELPGIGPVTAGKIIDNRPYSSVDELLSKKIVGQATFEKIQNDISL